MCVPCHHNDRHECLNCFISGFKSPLLTKVMPNRFVSEFASGWSIVWVLIGGWEVGECVDGLVSQLDV